MAAEVASGSTSGQPRRGRPRSQPRDPRPSGPSRSGPDQPSGGTGPDAEGHTVAVVLSGAAARGAFQAGALAVIVPELERQGLRPTIWLGTSAGAINAALWAAMLHEGSTTAADRVLAIWSQMSDDDVFRPLLPFSALRTAAQFAVGAMLQRGPGTTSVVDTTPLQRTATEELPADQLARNVAEGVVSAVGVVATRVPSDSDEAVVGAASGRSVLFLAETTPSSYAGDPDRGLDVVRTAVTADHVVASSAIPVGFPAVRLDQPEPAWYVDGGVRLNAPLQPAVALGATRILLVSATATTVAPPPPPAPLGVRPDIADAGAQVLHAALADRTVEDLLTLRRVNHALGQAPGLTSRSGRVYRPVEVMEVSPAPGAMGRLAADVWARRTDRLGWLRETDNWLIGRGLRGLGDAVGRRELLSYLFFDEEYFARGIELGQEAAATALRVGWTQ